MRIFYSIMTLALFLGCQSQPSSGNLNPDEFKKGMENEEVVILDVRTKGEVSRGIIQGAVHMDVTKSDFTQKASTLDKNKKYYVYCLSGSRSAKAAAYLKKIGVSEAYNLAGGLMAWQRNGYSIVTGDDQKDKISQADYQQMVKEGKVLVDFYAPWCAPCKRMEPMLTEIQEEHNDQLKIIRINIDENKRLAKEFGVLEIPIFKYYTMGDEQWEHKGELDEKQLRKKLNL